MKQSSLFCAGWWPFLVCPLLLLIPLLLFEWHAIEADVAANASQSLRTAEIEWAQVETFNRGREVLITGTPPNQDAIDRAIQVVSAAYGVRSVKLSADVKVPAAPPTPPTLNAIVTGESIVVRGILKDQAAIDDVIQRAGSVFGEENVVNKLSVGDNIAELPDLTGFFAGLTGKALGLGTLTATLDDSLLILKGEVLTEEVKNSLESLMRRLFPDQIDNQLTVAAPAAPPVEPDPCLTILDDVVNAGKINFESGKATIVSDSYAVLDAIAAAARRCPETGFEVAGHTDSVGRLAANKSLSERRAQAVVDHLAGLGLDAARFSAVGYGPEQPIADNDTPEGRAQNRRIEFKLKNDVEQD